MTPVSLPTRGAITRPIQMPYDQSHKRNFASRGIVAVLSEPVLIIQIIATSIQPRDKVPGE